MNALIFLNDPHSVLVNTHLEERRERGGEGGEKRGKQGGERVGGGRMGLIFFVEGDTVLNNIFVFTILSVLGILIILASLIEWFPHKFPQIDTFFKVCKHLLLSLCHSLLSSCCSPLPTVSPSHHPIILHVAILSSRRLSHVIFSTNFFSLSFISLFSFYS